MDTPIKKAIIPIAGLGTRFLPLSKVVPKEFFPLGEFPLVHRIVEELKGSGVQELIFVVGTNNKKLVLEYFKKSPRLEKFLEERGKKDLIERLRGVEKLAEGISISFVAQTRPLGGGHAVFQARKLVGEEPCFVVFPDDIIESKIPASLQLAQVFTTAQKPVLGLYRLPKEKISSYGAIEGEKIAHRVYQVKKIVEKPAPEVIPSDLALVGRQIITPEVFDYLKKAKPNKKGEIVLAEVLGEMVKDGKMVYGHLVEGKWLECGNIAGWLQSNVYMAFKHPEFGKEIQRFAKEDKLI